MILLDGNGLMKKSRDINGGNIVKYTLVKIREQKQKTDFIPLIDRKRTVGRPTHDYSNVAGWNFDGKNAGC